MSAQQEPKYGVMEKFPPITESNMAKLMKAVGANDPDDVFSEHLACFAVGHEAGLVAGRAIAEAERVDAKWSNGQTLQIDSYATGREIVNAHISNGCIHLSLTNGGTSWTTEVSLPAKWAG